MFVLRNVFFQYGSNTKLNVGIPNSILIKNTGTVTAYVNNFPLQADDVFTSNLLQSDMVDETTYTITFDTAGTGTRLVNVIASYVSEKKEIDHGPKC